MSYVGHLEVLHPSTGSVILELTGEAMVDPFAETTGDGSDPAPQLTALMERLTSQAVKALERFARPPSEPTPLGLTLAFVPRAALNQAPDGRKGLDVELASRDPIDAEVLAQARIQFANPGIDETTVMKLNRLPGGLYVVDAPETSALKPGDLVTTINGQPALPQVIHRARFGSNPIHVKVRRPLGDIAELSLR
jgi:hypothetical protein